MNALDAALRKALRPFYPADRRDRSSTTTKCASSTARPAPPRNPRAHRLAPTATTHWGTVGVSRQHHRSQLARAGGQLRVQAARAVARTSGGEFRVPYASRVLVSASRRNELPCAHDRTRAPHREPAGMSFRCGALPSHCAMKVRRGGTPRPTRGTRRTRSSPVAPHLLNQACDHDLRFRQGRPRPHPHLRRTARRGARHARRALHRAAASRRAK